MVMPLLTRRRFTSLSSSLGVVALGGGHIGGAFAAGGDPIKIATVSGVYAQTVNRLLLNQGYLQQFGLDPSFTLVADGSKIIGSLLSGELDVCMTSGFPQVLPAIEKGGRMKILATASNAVMSVIYSGKSDVKSIKDLKGRTVGIGSLGAMVHIYMVALLRKAGVDERSVNFVNIGGNVEIFRAVTAGVVDAGPGEPQFMQELDKYKIHVISEIYKELPEFVGQASYAATKVITERRDVLVRTLAAYRRLYRFIQLGDSRDAWIKARSEAMGRDESTEGLNQWNLIRRNNLMPVDLVMPSEKVMYMQDLNKSLDIQQKIISYEEAADMSLAREAALLEEKTR